MPQINADATTETRFQLDADQDGPAIASAGGGIEIHDEAGALLDFRARTVLRQGTLAARPALGLTSGEVYQVLDSSNALYRLDRWDGTSWQVDVVTSASAPVVGDDIADGYHRGTLWLDTTQDQAYVCIDPAAGAAIWKSTSGVPNGAFTLAFTDGAAPYVDTNSATYAVVARFEFKGTDDLGTLASMEANFYKAAGGTSVDIRIFDATNSNEIAEVTGVTSTDPNNLVDLGTLSNVPTGSSSMEVQLKRNGGTRARVGSLGLLFQ